MNRIASVFDSLSANGKKALIPYITPEFPFKGSTTPLLHSLAASGAHLIEVGIPFSDPLADGGTIQRSSEVAIKNGSTIRGIFDSVATFRKEHDTPIVLMGYYNPIYHFGIDRFCAEAFAAGIDGLIVPDLPPEEASELVAACKAHGLSNTFLIAPTTVDRRIQTIDAASTIFSYCVSVTGVTGAREQFGESDSLERFLRRVKEVVKKKFVVGFGISSKEQVQRVWQFADGAVVGSALITAIAAAATPAELERIAKQFFYGLWN